MRELVGLSVVYEAVRMRDWLRIAVGSGRMTGIASSSYDERETRFESAQASRGGGISIRLRRLLPHPHRCQLHPPPHRLRSLREGPVQPACAWRPIRRV